MANKSKVQSVEPDIADLVNGWLKSYGLDYKLEQASLNSEIDKALDEYHSKIGGKGGNRPDAKLLLKDKYGTFYPVLIEYKGYKDKLVKLDTDGIVDNKKDKNEPNYTNIKSYAVNGAIHYANAILHYTSYTRIIAIGVTGYKDEFGKLQHEIGVYYVSADKNNLGFGQRVGDYTDLSFLKTSHFDEFVEKLNELSLTQAEIDKLKEKREKEINISLVKLNNDIYKEETGLGENDRIYLVAATIIATLGAEGVKPLEKSDLGSSTLGKINASLNEKLASVEWGKYRIDDLFKIQTSAKRFDANKVNIIENGRYPYVVRTSSNNGQKGFLDENESFLNAENTISFGQDTATIFYQEKPYFTGDKIKVLVPKVYKFNKKNAQFFLASMNIAFSKFSWGSSRFNVDVLKEQVIMLPTKCDSIDFEFMESFIEELEAERIEELEAYLSVSGLKDTQLTADELSAVNDLISKNIEFKPFCYDVIFDKIVQGRRLKKDDQIAGDIPFVMAGVTNTGVVGYISNPVASFPKNSITIDIFGNAFYRNYDFGAGDDTGVYWSEKSDYSKEIMLFLTCSMGKSIENKFSYGKKLRSSQSFKFKMQLPVKNEQPDYELMSTLISAIQKLVIADVVKFSDEKIKATKQVVG